MPDSMRADSLRNADVGAIILRPVPHVMVAWPMHAARPRKAFAGIVRRVDDSGANRLPPAHSQAPSPPGLVLGALRSRGGGLPHRSPRKYEAATHGKNYSQKIFVAPQARPVPRRACPRQAAPRRPASLIAGAGRIYPCVVRAEKRQSRFAEQTRSTVGRTRPRFGAGHEFPSVRQGGGACISGRYSFGIAPVTRNAGTRRLSASTTDSLTRRPARMSGPDPPARALSRLTPRAWKRLPLVALDCPRASGMARLRHKKAPE